MRLPSSPIAILVLLASVALACGQLPLEPPVDPAPAPAGPAAAEAPGAEKAEPEKPKGPPPSPEKIKELIAQLESDDFRERDGAQLKLTGIGKTFPEATLDTLLAEFLDGTRPESRYRLRDILYAAKQAEFETRPRGFVGIVMMPSSIRQADGTWLHTIQVGRIVEGSAAERHGLLLRDQILSIDDLTFEDSNASTDFADYVTGKMAGDKVVLTVMRNNVKMKIPLTLGQRPPELLDYRVRQQFDKDFKRWLEENTARLRGGE